MYNIYITWDNGYTSKSKKQYRTKASAEKSVRYITDNYTNYRVIEIA